MSRSYSVSQKETTSGNRKPEKRDAPPEIPAFDFLGMMKDASPAVKLVVYGGLTIVATAETYTYGSWLWRKISADTKPEHVYEDA